MMLKKMITSSTHDFYYRSPVFLQHAMTSVYGYKLKRERYNRLYRAALKRYAQEAFDKEQALLDFMRHLKGNIKFYNDMEINEENILESFLRLPETVKDDLRKELDGRSHKAGVLRTARTSGTTGTNLIVYSSEHDRAERMAYLDYIKLQSEVAPFSKRASFTGQELTPENHGNILWRYNMPMNQVLYATYYMNPENVQHVYENMAKFKPVSLDGFPSAIHMVAKYILANNIDVDWEVKAVFPNAEILLPHVKADIEAAFGTQVIDQYASSEGAPFIYGTEDGRYRLGHETGIFEFHRVDKHLYEMVVTSFINRATPLVRYRIGDQVEIDSDKVYLNSYTDDIEITKIIGRHMDYLVGSGNNKVMNVNLSWIIDGFEEKVIQFQFVQKEKDRFAVNMVVESSYDKNADEEILRGRLERQLGAANHYKFNYIDQIPKEKSGKVRFIINEMSDVG